jgi:hypothetical protein
MALQDDDYMLVAGGAKVSLTDRRGIRAGLSGSFCNFDGDVDSPNGFRHRCPRASWRLLTLYFGNGGLYFAI